MKHNKSVRGWIALCSACPPLLLAALYLLRPANGLFLLSALLLGAAAGAASFRLCRGPWDSDPEIAQLRQRAQRDSLTELYNKETTRLQISRLLQEYPGARRLFIMVDLDNFKLVNDEKGHLYGDKVLREAAQRILAACGSRDIVGRVGGDEFAVLSARVPSAEAARRQLTALNEALRHPIGGFAISCSIGAVWYPEDGGDYNTLFAAADKALYLAKTRGKDQFWLGPPDCSQKAE